MQNGSPERVYGALLGTQQGRVVDIANTFEVPFNGMLDESYFIFKQEQYKQVFPDLEILGWYSNGQIPQNSDIKVHQQMMQYTESPLFLQIQTDVQQTNEGSGLPVSIYESLVDFESGTPLLQFVKSEYKIGTTEAERLAVDHIAHVSSQSGAAGSGMVSHLVGQQNAVSMLQERIACLVAYVEAVCDNRVTADNDVMRQIASLCNRLPAIDGNDFSSEFNADYNDVALLSLLSSITKGTHELQRLAEVCKSLEQQSKPTRVTSGFANFM